MEMLLKSTLFAATVFCAAIMLFASTAQAETTKCTPITTIPITITAQGIYCFNGNLAGSMASGNAIMINTNNVTIDFNGYKLGNLGAGPSTNAVGIYAYDRKNITIRNGTVRGFLIGIRLNAYDTTTASGHVVEGMRLDGNTYVGMSVRGTGAIVRNNQVVNTGGGASVTNAYGIEVYHAKSATVVNNTISNTSANSSAFAFGLYVGGTSTGSVIKNNRISNTSSGSGIVYPIIQYSSSVVVEENYISETTSTGVRYGIYAGGPYNTVTNNRITDTDTGVYCSTATVRIRDNITNKVTTPYHANCSNQGNNQ